MHLSAFKYIYIPLHCSAFIHIQTHFDAFSHIMNYAGLTVAFGGTWWLPNLAHAIQSICSASIFGSLCGLIVKG